MINTDYIKYLKMVLTGLINSGDIGNDITFGYHEEFYYEYENDVEITVSTLPGQINKGLVQIPIQVKIDVVDKFVDEIKTAIDEAVVNLNETSITLENNTYKQFYTTSTLISSFMNKNTIKYNSLTLSVTLVNFSNILGLTKLTINNNDVLGPLVSYAVSYEAQTVSTGGIGDSESKSVGKTYARTWNFAFVANTNNNGVKALLQQVIRGTNPNATITMIDKVSELDNADVSETMLVKTGSIEQELIATTLPILRVVLIKEV